MKLSFRGTKYDYNPITLEVTEEGIGGTYRGVIWKSSRYRQVSNYHFSDQIMTYRGVTYHQ
ncbi:MAG TPA: hypothetical protein DCF68_23280 [Cyanothece sp. UBA12306]|nr:hypothetical protein [Cyanothece sp. UBA12306]